jgi:hypothetical protein
VALPLALAGALIAAPAQNGDDKPLGVRVRHREGTVHGFLKLSDASGKQIASGDWLQTPRGNVMENRMVFRFADGSFFDESVTYTQDGVFRMQNYRLIQRGPAFPFDLDAQLSRSGAYELMTKSHDEDQETEHKRGTIEMPSDVYNGLPITIAKNLMRSERATVHLVAFTPGPRLIRLQIVPLGAETVKFGSHSSNVTRYALKPRLGDFMEFFAKLAGKMPPDSHAWILVDDVPAFLRFQGPLFTGPVWRIDLTTPTWP